MIYLTRELYELMQQKSIPWEDKDIRWRAAVEALQAHRRAIRPRLPASMQKFCDTTLHDGVIEAADRPAPDEVVLRVDSSGNPWGPRGRCTLAFRGVREAEGLDACTGEIWLYEEVHPHPDAGFDYRVLLGRSELRVVADEVEFRVEDPSPPPVVGVDIPFTGDGGLYVWDPAGGRGGAGGWFLLRDGTREARTPAPEVLEAMSRFARVVGGVLAGDGEAPRA